MASTSITHLILFIASLIVAASVAGVLTTEVGRVSDALSDQGLDTSHEIRADFEIISDSGSSNVYDTSTDNVTLYLKNTGSTRLGGGSTDFDVILDGTYHPNLQVTVLDDEIWGPGDVVRLSVHAPDLESGDHRIKVIVDGDEEVFEFRS